MSQDILATIEGGDMETDDMNTMDADNDNEPTETARPGVAAREPLHKHSLGDNTSIVDRSPINFFDHRDDPAIV